MKAVPPETFDALCSYRWPGTVGELQHVLERAVVLASDGIIYFDPTLESGPGATTSTSGPGGILRGLEDKGWVIDGMRGAAHTLGLEPNTLRSKMNSSRAKSRSSDSFRAYIRRVI
jgi:transcriptional regulator with GAF, ATPase, and Fis domain